MKVSVVGFVCFTLFIAACGESSSSEEATAGPEVDAGSPLDEFFEATEGADAAFAAFQMTVQESVAQCMTTEGFEYVAFVDQTANESRSELSEEEEIKQFGYGVSTVSGQWLSAVAENPNNAYLLSLPEADGKAFLIQLYGEKVGAALADEVALEPTVEIPIEQQGCSGQALIDSSGSELWDGFATFGAKVNSYNEAIAKEPAIIEATDAWVECMAANGYSYQSPPEPEQDIIEQFNALITPHLEAFSQLDPDQIARIVEHQDASIIAEFDLQSLGELQSLELEVAGNDHKCFTEHLAEDLLPRQYEIERQLLEEDGAVLTEIRDLVAS